MSFDDSTLDAIRRANPLADVVAREYCREVKPHGPGRQRTLCVFHDETDASLVLNENTNTFKCFGCGKHGDVFTLVMKLDGLSFPQAVEKLAKRAGISLNGSNGQKPTAMPTPREHESNADRERDLSAEWHDCVVALTDAHIERLATWRGYSVEFCQWLRQKELVGLHEGKFAFPVCERHGPVVAWHYRLDDGTWRYHPPGRRMRPLVIGEPETAESVFLFESQWDALAVLDTLDWHKQVLPSVAVIVTRGASNGGMMRDLSKPGVTVYAFRQNDVAADKWLLNVSAATADRARVKLVSIPAPHKDCNDWTRAGASCSDINAAMEAATEVKPFSTVSPVLEFLRPSAVRNYKPPEGIVLVGDCHIVRGSVFVIGGAPGVGKSRAAVALAVAGATGTEWFGLKVHTRFRTMIVQNENGLFRLSREFADLDCSELEDFVRVCPPPPLGLAFDRVDFQAALTAALKDFQPHVILIDPWNGVARDDKAKEYLETFDLIRSVIPCGDNGPALGIVAHTRKPKTDERTSGRGLLNLLAGSYVLGSIPRTVFVLQSASNDPEERCVVWTCCKNNDGELGQRSAWQRRNGLFAPEPDFDWTAFDGAQDNAKHKVSVQVVAEVVGVGNHVSYTRLAEAVVERCGVSERTAKSAIIRAVDANKIRKGEDGLYEVA